MMKKLFILLILTTLFSCEKITDRPTCWECTTITIHKTISPSGYIERDYSSDRVVICDHTETEIRAFEDQKTYTLDTIYFVRNFLTYGYVTESTCRCIK